MKTRLSIILFPHRYYKYLCGEYGCPEDVHKELAKATGLLKIRLNSYIKKTDKDIQDNYQRYLRDREKAEITNRNRCISCPWGNGEGGCTRDYCPERGGKIYE